MNTSYDYQVSDRPAVSQQEVALHLAKVMAWMFGGLIITVVAALVALYTPAIVQFVSFTSYGPWLVFGAQLALVVVVSSKVNSEAPAAISMAAFLAYSVLTGFTLSVLFMVFQLWSLILTFVITASLFFMLSVYGFVTKRDLSRVGSLLFFGLLALIMGSVANWFLGSVLLDYVITWAGIIIFIGLIAYDTQKVKKYYASAIYNGADPGGNVVQNLTIYGALSLYLDFINLFLYLLRLFGKRD